MATNRGADAIMVFRTAEQPCLPHAGDERSTTGNKENGASPLVLFPTRSFYTPIIMNYFLTGEFSTDQHIDLFEEDLSVYSFKELRAKPDTALFNKFIPVLNSKYNIEPSETIFVGKRHAERRLHGHKSRFANGAVCRRRTLTATARKTTRA